MSPERALATIDVGAIERNCARLPKPLCAVVKADGYGHGAGEAAQAALRGGAEWLAVATADEAAALRALDIDTPILVMGALAPAELRVALDAQADVVAWSDEVAAAVPRAHVKLDTGMGRLGTKDREQALRLAARDNVVGLMTHFATADEREDGLFEAQLEAFERFVADVGRDDLVVHAANSAATLREPRTHFDLVRCGIAIYGMDPFHSDPSDARARARARAALLGGGGAPLRRRRLGRLRPPLDRARADLGGHRADRLRRRLAPRALTNDCDVLIGGRRHPLVGTVSMDNVTVALGPDTDVSVGDEVVLIGRQGSERILAEEVARRLGTINYEVTCALSARVRREHVR